MIEKIKTKKVSDLLLALLLRLSGFTTLFIVLFIILYILIDGVPNIKPSLFSFTYTSENVSVLPSIITTILMTIISLCIAVPIGIFTAIYLVEYAKKGSKLTSIVRMTAETLSGIPSIVYGLFGSLFFVAFCNLGLSILSGALTLTIMILPLVIRATEEALLAVPTLFREGAYGLGAGKLRTVFKVVLPSAMPSILAGVILAIGRIVGETAALIYTAGDVAKVPTSVLDSGRTLSVHMYRLTTEALHDKEAAATAVILLFFVVIINKISNILAKKISAK